MKRLKNCLFPKAISLFVSLTFIFSPSYSHAAMLSYMPAPGTMIGLTESFNIPQPSGMIIDPKNPLKVTFIVDQGNYPLRADVLRDEASKIGRYFMAALTIPEKDLWVNLSPYEPERICKDALAETDLGKDMLGEDYVLKQLASSLTYPESEAGKAYWDEINVIGTNNHSHVNNFNKVWIVPGKITVYEGNNRVVIGEARLKVLTEEDYLAIQKNDGHLDAYRLSNTQRVENAGTLNERATQAFKTHILPLIEQEINQGKNFAQFRQVYHAVILAQWFKAKLKNSLLQEAYFDRNKIHGVNFNDPRIREKIYNQYVEAFKQGAYSYVKRQSAGTRSITHAGKITKHQYFSGGATLDSVSANTETKDITGAPPEIKTTLDNKARVIIAMVLPKAPGVEQLERFDVFQAHSVTFSGTEEQEALDMAAVKIMRIATRLERYARNVIAQGIRDLRTHLKRETDSKRLRSINLEIKRLREAIPVTLAHAQRYRNSAKEFSRIVIDAVKRSGVHCISDETLRTASGQYRDLEQVAHAIFYWAVDPIRKLPPLKTDSLNNKVYIEITNQLFFALLAFERKTGYVCPGGREGLGRIVIAIIECVNNHRHFIDLHQIFPDFTHKDPNGYLFEQKVELMIEAVYARLLAEQGSGATDNSIRVKTIYQMMGDFGDFGRDYATRLLIDYDELPSDFAKFLVQYFYDERFDPNFNVVYTQSQMTSVINSNNDLYGMYETAVLAGWRALYSSDFFIYTEWANVLRDREGINVQGRGCLRYFLADIAVEHLSKDITPEGIKGLHNVLNGICRQWYIPDMPQEDFNTLFAAVYSDVIKIRANIHESLETQARIIANSQRMSLLSAQSDHQTQSDGGFNLNNLSRNIETLKNGEGVEINGEVLATQLKNITGLTPVVIDVIMPNSRSQKII